MADTFLRQAVDSWARTLFWGCLYSGENYGRISDKIVRKIKKTNILLKRMIQRSDSVTKKKKNIFATH